MCVKAVEREPDSVPLLEKAGPLLLELGHTDHALKVTYSSNTLRSPL